MKVRITILYDEENNNYVENTFELQTDNIMEALEKCIAFKSIHNITPFGFMLMKYEYKDKVITIHEVKNYFFNGTLVPLSELPISIYTSIEQPCDHFIYVNDNFFVPFNKDTDVNLSINI